jgi:hypothetical protein
MYMTSIDPILTSPLSAQRIAGSVSAAFDSVSLINNTITITPVTVELAKTVDRNVGHLNIMLGKDWFVSALTSDQSTQINTCVASASAYLVTNVAYLSASEPSF